MGIMRLGFVHIRTNDLEASARHYRDTLGMQLSATVDGRQYFKGWDEFDHHSVVVEDGGVGLVKLGMKCASLDDLEIAARTGGIWLYRRLPEEARDTQFRS